MRLFSTEGCHLCHTAEALLREAQQHDATLSWTVVDIADDDTLFARYGWHIPVLRADARDAELRWPFDAMTLAQFLAEA